VLAIGYDLVEWSPKIWNGKRDKTIIHIDKQEARSPYKKFICRLLPG